MKPKKTWYLIELKNGKRTIVRESTDKIFLICLKEEYEKGKSKTEYKITDNPNG